MYFKAGQYVEVRDFNLCKICGGTGRAPDNNDYYPCHCIPAKGFPGKESGRFKIKSFSHMCISDTEYSVVVLEKI